MKVFATNIIADGLKIVDKKEVPETIWKEGKVDLISDYLSKEYSMNIVSFDVECSIPSNELERRLKAITADLNEEYDAPDYVSELEEEYNELENVLSLVKEEDTGMDNIF